MLVMPRMTKDELLQVLEEEESSCTGDEFDELSFSKARNMDYFLGKKVGNLAQKKGRSGFVMTTVRDSVLWILPSLLRIFSSGDICEFQPVDPDDEEGAEQETQYINWIYNKQNPGFLNTYSWFFDALVSKVGVLKAFWDESNKVTREEYFDLTEEQLISLASQDDVEITEHSSKEDVSTDILGRQQVVVLHDITLEKTTKRGRARIVPVPPEEFAVSTDCNSVSCKGARYTRQKRIMSRQELRDLGVSDDQIDKLLKPGSTLSEEELARELYSDEHENQYDENSFEVIESYICVDFDGDKRDELRRILWSGAEVLKNEETDVNPFYAITPVIITHKFFGLSIADLLVDIQDLFSIIMRNVIESLILAVHPKKKVVEGLVHMEDQLESRMSGIERIRGSDPANINAIQEQLTTFVGQQAFPMFEFLEKLQSQRSGVGELTQGLSAEQLSGTAVGAIAQATDMARMKIEMMARIFAETGFKELMLGIHKLVLQHQKQPRSFRLGKDAWVNVDPREWAERDDMEVVVGLGAGNKDQMLLHLDRIWQAQKDMIAGGGLNVLVTPQNIYNTWEEVVENAGLRDPSRFFTNPMNQQTPEQPDEQADAMKMAAQAEMEKARADQMKVQSDHALAVAELERKTMETQAKIQQMRDDFEAKLTELELKYGTNVPGSAV